MKKIIINKDLKLIQAIEKISIHWVEVSIVANKKKRLFSALTNGDIKPSNNKEKKLNESIKNIYNKNP